MDLKDLDIKGTIVSMSDSTHFIMRLAPQEIDRLTSVLYEGLAKGAETIIKQGIKDPNLAYKTFHEAVEEQLSSIEIDLAVKDLAKKFNLDGFLQQVLK